MRFEIVVAVVISALLVQLSSAVLIDLRPNHEKCVTMSLEKEELVRGDWRMVPEDARFRFTLRVTSPGMEQVLRRSDGKGSFAFKPSVAGEFVLCFLDEVTSGFVPETSGRRVALSIATGMEAKMSDPNYATQQKATDLELQVLRVNNLASEVLQHIQDYKDREASMAYTNESTSSSIVWFSFFSLLVVVGLGMAQVLYLKSFFRAKKLL